MKPWHLVVLVVLALLGAFGGWLLVSFVKGLRDR
jgi:hypothetical protein